MIITKTFFYLEQKHTILYHSSLRGDCIELDGTKCDNLQNFTSVGTHHVETYIVLNNDNLKVIVFGKKIYIFKDNFNIETGDVLCKSHNKKILTILFCLNLIPIFLLMYELYKNNAEILHRISLNTQTTIFTGLFMLLLGEIIVLGDKWCNYFLNHPIMKHSKKTVFIGLTIISVNLICIMVLISMKIILL